MIERAFSLNPRDSITYPPFPMVDSRIARSYQPYKPHDAYELYHEVTSLPTVCNSTTCLKVDYINLIMVDYLIIGSEAISQILDGKGTDERKSERN